MPGSRRVVRAGLLRAPCGFELPRKREELASLAGSLARLRDESVERQLALLATAARLGAGLVGLGELFGSPYFPVDPDPLWRELAEDVQDGPTVRRVRDAARRWELVVVAPIYEWDALAGKRFSTAVVVDADGSLAGSYRKVHLASGAGPHRLAEAFHYEPGDGRQSPRTPANLSANPFFPVFLTAAGRVGAALGEDRRLPGTIDSLAREGAEIIVSAQASSDEEARRLWDAECLTDAGRHRVFIGAANRGGGEAPWGRHRFEQAGWYGPGGKLPDESPVRELAVSDLDLASILETPESPLRPERDSRPEAYSTGKGPVRAGKRP